ncbi:MAG: DUF4825 domain-containing protein [Solobacterium sp.]|nr:DUF4825 domain-containing protein [Solobacterium sp.]
MKDITCEVIEDLLPLYADGIASEASRKLVEEHLKTCADCQKKLQRMQTPETPPETERHAVDFLKKNRRRNRHIMIGSILAALVLIAAVIGTRFYVSGDTLTGNWMYCDVEVNDRTVTARAGVLDSIHAVTPLKFSEQDGIVDITAKAVLPGIYHDSAEGTFTASEPVRQVHLNGNIIYDSGVKILPLAAEVFATAHPYMGSMPDNAASARALQMYARFGSFTNELLTESEPYTWRILLQDPVNASDRKYTENDMRRCAYVLIAVTGNLSNVEYVYMSEGSEQSLLVTKAEADQTFGQDVHVCGQDVRLLNRLMIICGMN